MTLSIGAWAKGLVRWLNRVADRSQIILRSYSLLIAGVGALLLLVLHVFWTDRFGVDPTAVALLTVILIIPYAHLVRRIRFGEFEAEIAPEEVSDIEAKTRAVEAKLTAPPVALRPAYSDIIELADVDPVLALAKLRMRLESALRRVAEFWDTPQRVQRSALAMAQALAERDVIDANTLAALRGALSVANRAIHGAEIDSDDARRVVDSGIDLLRYLDTLGTIEPRHAEPVSVDEKTRYQGAMYRVTTITPRVDQSIKNVYEVTQEQLDALLEGYNEYAEFLISVEPLEGNEPPSR